MTKREMFNAILSVEAVAANKEMVDFINHELELLNRKSSAKKPTKKQLENEGFKAEIITYLTEVDTFKTIKELQSEISSLNDMSNQRITHMLTALIKEGKVIKEYVKRTPNYCINH